MIAAFPDVFADNEGQNKAIAHWCFGLSAIVSGNHESFPIEGFVVDVRLEAEHVGPWLALSSGGPIMSHRPRGMGPKANIVWAQGAFLPAPQPE